MTLPYFLKDVRTSFPYGPTVPGRTGNLSRCVAQARVAALRVGALRMAVALAFTVALSDVRSEWRRRSVGSRVAPMLQRSMLIRQEFALGVPGFYGGATDDFQSA